MLLLLIDGGSADAAMSDKRRSMAQSPRTSQSKLPAGVGRRLSQGSRSV